MILKMSVTIKYSLDQGQDEFVVYNLRLGNYLYCSQDGYSWDWVGGVNFPVTLYSCQLHSMVHDTGLMDLDIFIGNDAVVCFPIKGNNGVDCMVPYNLDDFKDDRYK